MIKIIAILVLLTSLFSCTDHFETVRFHGYVYDASNSQPLEGVAIHVSTACSQTLHPNGKTNDMGYYSFKKEIDCTCEAYVLTIALRYVSQTSPRNAVSCDNGRYDFYLLPE